MTSYTPICRLEDLPIAKTRAFELEDQKLLLCRTPDQVFAIENRCTHQNTPLEGGRVRGGYISCPLHGVRFNLATGEPMGTLTQVPVKTFAVRVENDEIAVSLEAS